MNNNATVDEEDDDENNSISSQDNDDDSFNWNLSIDKIPSEQQGDNTQTKYQNSRRPEISVPIIPQGNQSTSSLPNAISRKRKDKTSETITNSENKAEMESAFEPRPFADGPNTERRKKNFVNYRNDYNSMNSFSNSMGENNNDQQFHGRKFHDIDNNYRSNTLQEISTQQLQYPDQQIRTNSNIGLIRQPSMPQNRPFLHPHINTHCNEEQQHASSISQNNRLDVGQASRAEQSITSMQSALYRNNGNNILPPSNPLLSNISGSLSQRQYQSGGRADNRTEERQLMGNMIRRDNQQSVSSLPRSAGAQGVQFIDSFQPEELRGNLSFHQQQYVSQGMKQTMYLPQLRNGLRTSRQQGSNSNNNNNSGKGGRAMQQNQQLTPMQLFPGQEITLTDKEGNPRRYRVDYVPITIKKEDAEKYIEQMTRESSAQSKSSGSEGEAEDEGD